MRRTFPSFRLSVAGAAAVVLAVVVGLSGGTDRSPPAPRAAPAGIDARVKPSRRRAIAAAFARESYAPGAAAHLVLFSSASEVSVQLFRAGREPLPPAAHDVMEGGAVTEARYVGAVRPRREVWLRIGNWPSGLYFAELTSFADGRVGYAPFVLRPRRLGEHRVAVVVPTQTWQAYNFRDDDRDGLSDTWYAKGHGPTARLARPFSDQRGVPPHYKEYDEPFLTWLAQTGHDADYLADSDLNNVGSGFRLARAYALVIFPGHHEYVTQHEYDVVTGFRNRGGNLMFLSANNFYWKIVRHGNVMRRIARWRDLGRPEAALIGVQYFANDRGQHHRPWVVRRRLGWLFAHTGVQRGSRIVRGGIEADRRARSSPYGTAVVAEIPNLYGRGMTPQMTYYERRGARVFAAGAFTLAGSVWQPPVRRMMANLWARLAYDSPATAAPAATWRRVAGTSHVSGPPRAGPSRP